MDGHCIIDHKTKNNQASDLVIKMPNSGRLTYCTYKSHQVCLFYRCKIYNADSPQKVSFFHNNVFFFLYNQLHLHDNNNDKN